MLDNNISAPVKYDHMRARRYTNQITWIWSSALEPIRHVQYCMNRFEQLAHDAHTKHRNTYYILLSQTQLLQAFSLYPSNSQFAARLHKSSLWLWVDAASALKAITFRPHAFGQLGYWALSTATLQHVVSWTARPLQIQKSPSETEQEVDRSCCP